ncbi:MAG: hypothetical protein D6734_02315 [Candidatus Schekmanbacteria bacterium]|nr:MAG: hypothetical protein D6734_02315 [Candidatus Schekmanbacteria bacterium]
MKRSLIIFSLLLILVTPLLSYAKEDIPLAGEQQEMEKKPGGIKPCLISIFIGPRAAFEYNEGRKIRTSEKFCLTVILSPIVKLLDGIDAYKGKTMSEIVVEEDLDEKAIKEQMEKK